MNERFFAAANTGSGFESDFCTVFAPEKFKRIYIIKGGPGTGKSTFMKKIGGEAERRGYSVGYCFCSSDVNSLDGVVIKEPGVCIIDGTAPHTTDPKYPGACEVILNFVDAFDVAALAQKRFDIARISAASAEHYSRAYRALGASKSFFEAEISCARRSFLQKKATSFMSRLFSSAKAGKITYRRERTVCRAGEYRLLCAPASAKTVYTVKDYYGTGALLLETAERYLADNGLCATVCRGAICPGIPDAVIAGDICLISDGDDVREKYEAKSINPRRFDSAALKREERGYARLCTRLLREATDAAVKEFTKAGEAHDELEKIYGAHTDFGAIDALYERVKNDIFENKM